MGGAAPRAQTKIIPGGFHEWPIFTTKDFRFTAAPNGVAIFLFVMRWAPGLAYSVASLNASAPLRLGGASGTITDVTLLGSSQPVPWSRDSRALHLGPIPPPAQPETPVGLRVHLDGASVRSIDEPSRAVRENILR